MRSFHYDFMQNSSLAILKVWDEEDANDERFKKNIGGLGCR